MAFRRSIRNRRSRRKMGEVLDLQITSLMDVLVIILVFLLKSAAVASHQFQAVPGIEIPLSQSPDIPPDSLYVILTPEAITFENERILDFLQSPDAVGANEAKYSFKRKDLDEGGRRIVPLYDALVKAKEKSEALRTKSKARDEEGNPLPFDGILAIEADKRVSYDTIRRVMYTGASAGYRVFRLLALQKDTY